MLRITMNFQGFRQLNNKMCTLGVCFMFNFIIASESASRDFVKTCLESTKVIFLRFISIILGKYLRKGKAV